MAMSSQVMRETFKLPKLPGNNFSSEMMKKSYHKKQVLQPHTGPRPAGVDRVPVDFEVHAIQEELASSTDDKPQELSLDRKVLRFSAYFKEGVHESRFESERVRRCMLYYFLEDDTISVSEPKEDNSGMPQGYILKRHRIAKPGGGYFSFEDLNVGAEVTLYGKCFHLCDCDLFTRKFMAGLGIEVPPGERFPDDSYHELRSRPEKFPKDAEHTRLKAVMEYNFSGKRSRLGPEELKAAKQFLMFDRKVLKFKARWDDRDALYGDDRLFTLYYFLADDTIEVTEELSVNAGRDPFPSFVRRQRCAKPSGKLVNPSASLNFRNDPQEYYTDADLYVGAEVEVFGRKFFLFSCDEFTKKYLREVYGRDSSASIDVTEPQQSKPKPEPPPYNGFGDEEDSLGSWKHLVLKPPKKNVKQYVENAGHVLKFAMKMDSDDPANDVRRFVLTYYLADDTVSIFEPAQRNSGIIGGKFLQRQKAKRTGTNQVLKAEDFYVGARISINSHKFIIYATDEASLTHMEQNSEQFALSNINVIMAKLRAMLLSKQTNLAAEMHRADRDRTGSLDYKELAEMFTNLGLPLSEHEVLTALRYLDVNLDGSVTYQELIRAVLPEEPPDTDPRPWQDIYGEFERGQRWEKKLQQTDVQSFVGHTDTMAQHAARFFLDRYAERRVLFHNTFRSVADHSPDGKIGPPEFKKAVRDKLKLGLDIKELDALCSKLFPPHLTRIAYEEFLRIIQGTSLHDTTCTNVAGVRRPGAR